MSWSAIVVGLGKVGLGYDLTLARDNFVYSHARALSLHPDFKLLGAVEPNSCARAAFQKHYQAPAYMTLKEALTEVSPDLIVLATPTVTHRILLEETLKFGNPKAVLCEKPLAYDLSEARKMIEICEDKGTSLFVNYMRRSEPGALEVKRRLVNEDFAGPMKGFAWYSKGFLHNGSHFFNLCEYWLGQMRHFKLLNRGRSLLEGDAEPDVYVEFENGEVLFLAAKEENFFHNSIELIATNGRLRYEDSGRCISWNGIADDTHLENHTSLASPAPIRSELHRYQWHVTEQMANILAGRKAHLCAGKQGLQTLEAMHFILENRK